MILKTESNKLSKLIDHLDCYCKYLNRLFYPFEKLWYLNISEMTLINFNTNTKLDNKVLYGLPFSLKFGQY